MCCAMSGRKWSSLLNYYIISCKMAARRAIKTVSQKHLFQSKQRCLHRKMLPDFRKTSHVEDFSTSQMWSGHQRKCREDKRLWQKETKWRFKPATDLLFDSFQVQTPKDQRPNIPKKTISQSDHLETRLWTEMDWVNDNGYWSFWGVLWTLTRLPRVNNCTLNWKPDLTLSFQWHFTSLCVSSHC